ncbi:MAG: aminoacyl-tRNA hydrolase [bacterium]|nr:aminoacyl-tRNA hydrolase [bacterium]
MKIIVGLGNPGTQYRNTRHNVGFRAVDCVTDRLGISGSREKHDALLAEGRLGAERILVVKPLTFMNRSGLAVAKAARNAIEDMGDLLVVVDDVELPLGRVRFRASGSAGGHNGLKSIIEHVGTRDFPRLRLGVGREASGDGLIDHVLSSFRPEEWPVVNEMVERAADGVLRFLEAGIETAMNEFNGKPNSGADANDA